MIDFYYWTTPNGHKISIFFEESGLEYQIKPINIGEGKQFSPEFLKISPNNKIPAIVDHSPTEGASPISIFESGAILLYLADKTRQFIPQNIQGRYNVLQWLFWQVAGLGPMAGQNHHFTQYASEVIPYAINRYVNETNRLYAVLNQQLSRGEYIADQYSIADMACYPWIVPYEKQQQNLEEFSNIKRWMKSMQNRPAVQRAYALIEKFNPNTEMSDAEKNILFGQNAKVLRDNLEKK